jgi:hypothetical protein
MLLAESDIRSAFSQLFFSGFDSDEFSTTIGRHFCIRGSDFFTFN